MSGFCMLVLRQKLFKKHKNRLQSYRKRDKKIKNIFWDRFGKYCHTKIFEEYTYGILLFYKEVCQVYACNLLIMYSLRVTVNIILTSYGAL